MVVVVGISVVMEYVVAEKFGNGCGRIQALNGWAALSSQGVFVGLKKSKREVTLGELPSIG